MSRLLTALLQVGIVVSLARRLVAGGPRPATVSMAAPTPGASTRPGTRVPDAPPAPDPNPAADGEPVALAKRIVKRVMRARVTDAAAAQTYYTVMAIVPSLLVVIALVGIYAEPQSVLDQLSSTFGLSPDSGVYTTAEDFLNTITRSSSGGAPAVVALGTITALWAFSGLMANMVAAVNRVWELEETRSWPKRRLIAIGLAIGAAVVALGAVVAIGLAAGASSWTVEELGLGSGWKPVFRVVPFVLLAALLMFQLAVVYWIAPNKDARRWRWISAGALVAVVIGLLALLAFAVYVLTFASYSRVYGKLASIVIALLAIWLINLSILVGAAVDAELERSEPPPVGTDA